MSKSSVRIGCAICLPVLLLLCALPTKAESPDFERVRSVVKSMMEEWRVPGIAIAVVRANGPLFIEGFGVRELGGDSPVDAHTVFGVGAATRAFTAAALGLLVHEGKISWDDPVAERLPGFQLFDPYVTREITIRDLLSNRGGLGVESELICYGTDLPRGEIVRRLRFIKPEASLRSRFAYRRAAYVAAGEIIPAVTGRSWDDFVVERLLKPIDMKRSSVGIKALDGLDNVATPHTNIDGNVTPFARMNLDNIGPAASINSTASDMANWLRMFLANGIFNWAPVLPYSVLTEMHKPHIFMPYSPDRRSSVSPSTHFVAYCLGWVAMDYQGRMILWHTGNMDGMTCHVGLIPEENLGVVILSNYDGAAVLEPLFYTIVDECLGLPAKDWNAVYRERNNKIKTAQAEAERALEKTKGKGSRPSLSLQAFEGIYESKVYGPVKVVDEGDELTLHFSSRLSGRLEHWNYNTFRVAYPVWSADIGGNGKFFVSFSLDTAGEVSEMNYGGILTLRRTGDIEETGGK